MSMTPELAEVMVDSCDRLLNLLTGTHAVSCPARQEAAHEALSLLSDLESHLIGCAGQALPPLQEDALASLKHRERVLEHVNDVVEALRAAGFLPS